MPPSSFDPCRQWLGIDAVDLTDPRRALGVSADESDPQVVLRAAGSRLKRLQTVDPGPFERAREALLRRIEEAREAVLAEIASGGRPATPRSGGLSMPPPPGNATVGHASPAAAVPFVPRPPAVPTVPRPPAAPPAWPGDDDGLEVTEPTIRVRPTVTYRKQSSGSGVLLLVIVALAAAAGGLYWYKFQAPRNTAQKQAAQGEKSAAPSPEDTRSDPAEAGRRQRRERFGVPNRVVSNDEPPDDKPSPQPRPRRDTGKRDSDGPAPAIQPPAEPMPAAPPATAEVPEVPTEDTGRIDASLGSVRDALRSGDFAAAQAALQEASRATSMPSSRERVERWTELVTFAMGFDDYRKQALAGVKSGDEYDISGKKVAVVEIDDEKFIYRHLGRNRTTPRDRIPGKIVMAIVTAWFDDKAANDLYIGAYHATKQEPDLESARAAWEKAQAGGADASLLLPLLEDPILIPRE